MSVARTTPRTDAATFWGRDMGGDKGPPHFECVDADVARQLEIELVETCEALSGRTVSCSLCNEAARKIEDMRTVIQQAHEAFKNLMNLTPNVPPWANTEATLALAKLQSHLHL